MNYNVIGPDYFATMNIPLLQGRGFEDRDGYDRPRVVIVNQAAARRLWGEQNPVGQRVALRPASADPGEFYEVVGVAADSRYERVVDPIRPQLYLTFQQQY